MGPKISCGRPKPRRNAVNTSERSLGLVTPSALPIWGRAGSMISMASTSTVMSAAISATNSFFDKPASIFGPPEAPRRGDPSE